MSFKEDLKTGKDIEVEVLGRIKKKHPTAFSIDGYCKSYDIFIPEVSMGVEVKYDEMSAETGNLVVEIKMNDKLSALSTTLAHYWIFVTTAVYIWIKPDRIKDCIIQNNLQMRTFTGAGDTKQKDAYLIKETLLRQYAEHVNTRSIA